MTGECARENFICNGALIPTTEFYRFFNSPSKYIYDVFRVQEGVPVFIEDHLDRLWKTADLELIHLPFSRDEILSDIFNLIQSNCSDDGNIKVFISLSTDSTSTRLVYFTPHHYPTADQFAKGVSVNLFNAGRINPNAKVMDTSLRSATDQVKASKEVYEVLLVDVNGFITEGSRSNVFFIMNQMLITPPVHTVLEGITRKQIIKLCFENGIAVSEQLVHHTDLKKMEAVFISGTSRRVLPVYAIENHVFNVQNSLIIRLQQLLDSYVKQYIGLRKAYKNQAFKTSGF